MPRFVVLQHNHPVLHWDLMLEADGALLTWRLPTPPAAGSALDAAYTFAHRLVYLDYEGPISGGRGQVVRWDGGAFAWQQREEGRLAVLLDGARLRCLLELACVEGATWRATFGAGQGGSGAHGDY